MAKKPKIKRPTFQELEKERDELYISKNNPTRLNEIIKKLNFYYFGIN